MFRTVKEGWLRSCLSIVEFNKLDALSIDISTQLLCKVLNAVCRVSGSEALKTTDVYID